MHTIPPRLHSSIIHPLLLLILVLRLALGRRRRLVLGDQKLVQVAPSALTREIGIVRRRYETDRPGGARIQVARHVDALLNLVRAELTFVVHHRVVRGLHVTLYPRVRLEIKVEIEPA